MYKSAKRGWYKLLNPLKFIKPQDRYMKSFNESSGEIEFKSSLELKAMKYCDYNKFITKWSVEPFHIKYLKPCDGKYHRYYIDFFIEFNSKDKFLVEIKSYSETIPPKIPSRKTEKAMINYKKALETFQTNTAKWEAAKEFCKERGMKFLILTENELK